MAIDIDPHKVNFAERNTGVYKVRDKSDFFVGDFFSLHKLTGDVVFLAPSTMKPENGDSFSIYQHIAPDLQKLVEHALTISQDLCIKLPAYTSLDEVAAMLARVYKKSPRYIDSSTAHQLTTCSSYVGQNFHINIEQVVLNEVNDCIVVYLGRCAEVTSITVVTSIDAIQHRSTCTKPMSTSTRS